MKFGFAVFPTAESMHPGAFAALLESRGFESVFFPDHTHIPARNPGHYDPAMLPDEFRRGMDCFVALAAAAQATERITLGTAVTLVTARDPLATAKAVASLDVLSAGRLEFGVGPGWIVQEVRDHGVRPKDRWRVQKERIEAMKEIWTRDVASYHGEFVDFEGVTSWPKPVRHPYPPILVAGNGPTVTERVREYGDGWIPMLSPTILDRIAGFRRRARVGGTGEPPSVTLFGGVLDDISAYARAGVDRCLFWPRPMDPARTRRLVDRVALRLGARLSS